MLGPMAARSVRTARLDGGILGCVGGCLPDCVTELCRCALARTGPLDQLQATEPEEGLAL